MSNASIRVPVAGKFINGIFQRTGVAAAIQAVLNWFDDFDPALHASTALNVQGAHFNASSCETAQVDNTYFVTKVFSGELKLNRLNGDNTITVTHTEAAPANWAGNHSYRGQPVIMLNATDGVAFGVDTVNQRPTIYHFSVDTGLETVTYSGTTFVPTMFGHVRGMLGGGADNWFIGAKNTSVTIKKINSTDFAVSYISGSDQYRDGNGTPHGHGVSMAFFRYTGGSFSQIRTQHVIDPNSLYGSTGTLVAFADQTDWEATSGYTTTRTHADLATANANALSHEMTCWSVADNSAAYRHHISEPFQLCSLYKQNDFVVGISFSHVSCHHYVDGKMVIAWTGTDPVLGTSSNTGYASIVELVNDTTSTASPHIEYAGNGNPGTDYPYQMAITDEGIICFSSVNRFLNDEASAYLVQINGDNTLTKLDDFYLADSLNVDYFQGLAYLGDNLFMMGACNQRVLTAEEQAESIVYNPIYAMTYSTVAQRDALLPAPSLDQIVRVDADKSIWKYNGSAWVQLTTWGEWKTASDYSIDLFIWKNTGGVLSGVRHTVVSNRDGGDDPSPQVEILKVGPNKYIWTFDGSALYEDMPASEGAYPQTLTDTTTNFLVLDLDGV